MNVIKVDNFSYFLTVEFLFLLWGIRLCIMVRKAPSEFNESRFISMTIYNEFLLSIFLNVSMFFLQHPANPDLLYIIFFCHSQLTITILLCLIFASKFYLVMKGQGKHDDVSERSKNGPGKFVASKVRAAHASMASQGACGGSNPPTLAGVSSIGLTDGGKLTDKDIQNELEKIYQTLSVLKDKSMSGSNAKKFAAIQEALLSSSGPSKNSGQQKPSEIKTITGQCTPMPPIPSLSPPLGSKASIKASGSEKSLDRPVSNMMNGQIVNCESSPLKPSQSWTSQQQDGPTNVNAGKKNGVHQSPVIVHSSVTLNSLLKTEDKDKTKDEGEDNKDQDCRQSRSSSCHSSRCCCSSYSCCSPHGSIECNEVYGQECGDTCSLVRSRGRPVATNAPDDDMSESAASNSVDVALKAMQDRSIQLPSSSQVIQHHLECHSSNRINSQEEPSPTDSIVVERPLSIKQKPTSKAAQRIIMNLDDKSCFTDEVTV